MEIKKAEFLITVVSRDKILTGAGKEFAFVGRSNVGKSSLINALTCNKKLAKTSSTPGLTKAINYFRINDGEFHIIDLPGYGYHRAGDRNEEKWTTLMEDYFLNSPNLKTVFLLLDIRHLPSELDRIMINFLTYHQISYVVVATKADKLSKLQQDKALKKLSEALKLPLLNIILSSSTNRLGIKQILSKIEQYC